MTQDTRRKLLKAAADVVVRSGAAHMTLDEVAAAANVSKGGLLYHFASKKALILALIEQEIEKFDLACEVLQTSTEPGSYTRAYLHATLENSGATASGVLSAIASDQSLLEPLQQAYMRWQAALEKDGIDPVIGTLVRLVADGFWFSALIGAPAIRPALLKELVVRLDTMTEVSGDNENA